MFNARFPSASVHDCGRSDLRSTQQGVAGWGGSLQSLFKNITDSKWCVSLCKGVRVFWVIV